MVVVSQPPDFMRIQARLAENLGLSSFTETTKEGRAERLLHRLQSEKKVLIILDDVWDHLGTEDLKNMGIAFDDDQKNKGWKILLTTRFHNVCTSMDCQKKIFLKLLPEVEAWDLFKIKANLRDEDRALINVAEKVAKECKRLPLAIVVVGTILRGKKTVKEWKVAHRQLKTLLEDNKHAEKEKNVYACLKMSYDYLNRETKLCLLLCSLFPEDHDISIEDLTRYAIGCGLCNDDDQLMEEARDQVFVAIKELKDSCMLLDAESSDHVKMHDLVRDVALQVASQGEHVFLVKAGYGLKEWPTNINSFENFTAISLMGNDISELPNGLVCPRLKILMVGRAEYDYRRMMGVPDKFFEGMGALEVLSLKCASLSLQALELLGNLHFLELFRCDCKDIASLRMLQRLEFLSFYGSHFKELPIEIGELKKLRLLDLSECWGTTIPRNLFERFGKLEELYMGAFRKWNAAGTETEEKNASIAELNSLSRLTALSLNVPKARSIPEDFVFPAYLRRYEIMLGDERLLAAEFPTSRRLIFRFKYFEYFNAKTFKQLFPNVCELDLLYIEGYKNMIPEMDEGSFENLVYLRVNACLGMECLVDTTHEPHLSTAAFLNLKDMYIYYTYSLKELCKGRPPMGFLQKLQTISASNCEGISTLFPAKLWQALQNLEAVEIDSCSDLQEIFELDGVFDEANGQVLLLSKLTTLALKSSLEIRSIWKGPTRHVSLRNLTHLSLDSCGPLKFIFTLSLAQSLSRLETLGIFNCDELKHIIREKEDDDDDDDEKVETIPKTPCLPKLTTLSINCCPQLEYVFPISVAPSLARLEELSITWCRQLKGIFGRGGNGGGDALEEDVDGILVFPRLRKLTLFTDSQLSYFCPKITAIKLPSLQRLLYKSLNSSVWPQFQDLTNLKELQIKYSEEEAHEFRGMWNHLTLENITALEVAYCKKMKNVFPRSIVPSLVQLKSLKISWCGELEEIIAWDNNEDEKDTIVLESHDLQSLGFPNLCEIEVSSCEKMKRLFPVTIAAGLPRLKKLKVDETSELTEVFGAEEAKAAGIINNVEREIVVPNLVELSLEYLPKLVYFSPPNYHVTLPRLVTLTLKSCPKITTKFTTAPYGYVIAKSEAHEDGPSGSTDQ